MRRWSAIAKATALEILSEPLSLLLLLSALALVTLAPALHYHQFGEPTRMARDAGLSSLFTFATVFAVVGIYRSFRREIESGTAQMAVSHSVSRRCFFLSKFTGGMLAYAVFAVIIASVSLVMVQGAHVGGIIAGRTGDIARIWGPALSAGAAVIVVPPVTAAVLNRFFRFRFVPSSFWLALAMSIAAAAWFFDFRLAVRLASAWVPLVAPAAVFVAAAAAFAAGLKPHLAIAGLVVCFVAFVPAVGNYYLADSLSKGSSVPWMYVGSSVLAAIPAVAAFLYAGVYLFERRDIA